LIHGSANLIKWQFFAGAWVICWSAIATFIIAKVVNLVIPLRMSQENMEIGDVAEHGHEVYPSDVPSLGYSGAATAEPATA
jgi:Amt family ammonium transporter